MKNSNNLLFLSLLAIVLGGCNGIFYQPTRTIQITPEKLNYTFAEVYFKSLDETVLNGWFIHGRGKIKGTVLHFHGNGANISNHYAGVYWLPDEGYHLFLFDYRGYGKSDGIPSRQGVQMDGAAALAYIRSRPEVDPNKIIIYGQSLGGAVAAYTVATQPREGIRAVILESVFTSYRKIAREKLGGFWLTWPLQWPLSFLVSDEGSPLDVVSKISPIPLLILHGNQDNVIPLHHSEDLFRAAKPPKSLWIIEGGRHIDTLSPSHREYRKKFLEFLDQTLHRSAGNE